MKNILFILTLIISGCNFDPCVSYGDKSTGGECPQPNPKPNPKPNPDVITPPIPEVSPCSTACIHFHELKCPEGDPTNDGASCETVCQNMQSTGMIVYDLACAAEVKSCAAIAQCPRQ